MITEETTNLHNDNHDQNPPNSLSKSLEVVSNFNDASIVGVRLGTHVLFQIGVGAACWG